MTRELLTTLSHVKTWLGIDQDNTDSDDTLNLLIHGASSFLLNYLNRGHLAVKEYVEVYDTYGKNWLMLRNYPAQSITSILFCGQSITTKAVGNPRTKGYLLQDAEQAGGPQRLTLFGSCFPYMRSSTDITYTAGYQTSETYVIPASAPSTLTTDHVWLGGLEVAYEDTGVGLVLVSSNPQLGEYTLSTDGTYGFNIGDGGKSVDITYSYVPDDIEQACYQLVGDQFKAKDRIGYKSKTLGGQETVVFETSDMTDYTRRILNSYIRVVPL